MNRYLYNSIESFITKVGRYEDIKNNRSFIELCKTLVQKNC